MRSEKVNRQKLIEVAIELFRTKGYHNTTMDDIAKACNIKKPSIYHHIASREALLNGAIDSFHAQFKENVLSFALDTSLSVNERFISFAQALESFFIDKRCRCFVGSLVHELSGSLPSFESKAKDFFREWSQTLTTLLNDKSLNNPQEQAEDMIAQIQGALLLVQLNNDTAPLKRATQQLLSIAN